MATGEYLSEYYKAIENAAYVYGTDVAEMESVLGKWNLTPEQIYDDWVKPSSISNGKTTVIAGRDGSLRFYNSVFDSVAPEAPSVNSNQIVKRTWSVPVNTTNSVSTPGRVAFKSGMREAGKFFTGKVIPATMAAGIGITLGKTIDSVLYNLRPDFWDSHGMETLNPETWNTISSDDSILGTVFDTIFGIDNDGNTQMYVDEDTLGYTAQWLKDVGFFDSGGIAQGNPPTVGQTFNNSDFKTGTVGTLVSQYMPNTGPMSETYWNMDKDDAGIMVGFTMGMQPWGAACKHGSGNNVSITSNGPYEVTSVEGTVGRITPPITLSPGIDSTWYIDPDTGGKIRRSSYALDSSITTVTSGSGSGILVNYIDREAIPGIGDQTGATIPDTSSWTTPQTALQSIQNQYPDLWNGAKHYDYIDENGQERSRTYIPVNFPITNSPSDTRPTSEDRVQSDPIIDPNTFPNDTTKTITETLTDGAPGTPPNTSYPDTGSGDTPTVVLPTGEASSLWAIYNPTQAQLDAFGSWLWSSNFVEQLKKLFNDPMQAIIGVHKVFVTPSTGGQVNIKCGYIDSGCPAAAVTSQYNTISCGTVNVREYFGNVFDYHPHTSVKLYLPFIGIVDLDVADVMRGSVSVVYHVDVITGACLAEVKINRDGGGGVIYQYAGSAIVTYPISSGSYASAVTGVLSLAAGVAGTIMTGGAAAPALIGGAVGLSHIRANVQHSGNFSGCPGAMGGKKPYLIISRPQTALPDDFGENEGYPASKTIKLKNCSGFTKVKSINIDNVPATYGELDQIVSLLKTGVII